MAWTPILVRYGEIGIKSRTVRIQFERRLLSRIEEALVRRGVEAEITRPQGRLLLHAADVEGALDALAHTFGVVSASPARSCAPTVDAVAAEVLDVAREALPQGASFAVRVKRAGTHGFTSLDVAKACASRILDELADRQPRVDLDEPDLEMKAEVREDSAWVFTRTVRGPGGLPLGSQGRVAVLVESPRAAHAAWLLGKRGAALHFFAADPARAKEWLAPLGPWIGEPVVRPLPEGPRRALFEALGPEMGRHKCHALVLADGLEGQIAGRADDEALGHPVFRPLVGYGGARFAELARLAELPVGA